ncbi:helix-turn-helix domain-containing protein [Streptomyces sp. NPDC001054]
MPRRRTSPPPWVLDRRRALGDRIAHLRRDSGLSQDKLADAVGVERRTIQRCERGERDPGYGELLLIAHALDCEVRDLLP